MKLNNKKSCHRNVGYFAALKTSVALLQHHFAENTADFDLFMKIIKEEQVCLLTLEIYTCS